MNMNAFIQTEAIMMSGISIQTNTLVWTDRKVKSSEWWK